jgi:hypothetical protein
VTWLLFFGVYLLLAQDCSPPELVAGSASAGLATSLLEGLRRVNAQPFRVRASWWPRLLRQVPITVLRDSVRLIRLLGTWPLGGRRRERSAAGQIVSRHFDSSHEERVGEARARQALVVLSISLPPNSFAIAVESPPDRLLVHELVPSRPAESYQDPEWPL